jgi:uridine kinase
VLNSNAIRYLSSKSKKIIYDLKALKIAMIKLGINEINGLDFKIAINLVNCNLKEDLDSIFNSYGYLLPSVKEDKIKHACFVANSMSKVFPLTMEKIEKYTDLFIKVENLMQKKSFVCMAIDGGAASGKTTLANILSERYGAPIIHMDDFFLRPEQRTPERFAEAGENFDRERFLREVVPYIRNNQTFSYQIFDCSAMSLGGYREIPQSPLIIIEGSYSHHPEFSDIFDLRVFLSVSEDERKKRILARNGEKSEMFFTRWIPLENKYFEAFSIREKADFIIDG